MSDFEFIDRYKALGIPRPDPATVCQGQCEGVGFYPQYVGKSCAPIALEIASSVDDLAQVLSDKTPKEPLHVEVVEFQLPDSTEDELRLWNDAHEAAGEHQCDGYHFIKCFACNGTGKKVA